MPRKIQKHNVSKNTLISIPVILDGGLLSSSRAEMVNELMKYFMFERQQIPMTLDLIRQEVQRHEQGQHQVKGRIQHRLEMKKAKDLIEKLQETFAQVYKAFEVCPEIKKAVVVLGATAVTPKEVFVIEMPPLSPDADNLPAKACIQSLFQQLILQDPLGNLKQISPTNMTLLLHAPRNSSLAWFFPKPAYRLPDRGKQFHFKLQNNCSISRHDLSHSHDIVDLSGFEPLDITTDEVLLSTSLRGSLSGDSDKSLSADYVCITSDCLMDVSEGTSSNNTTLFSSSDLSSSNRTPTGSSKKTFKKSSSTSSILSQASAISQISSTLDRTNELLKGVEASNCDTKLFDCDEFIWFQAPCFVKGYRAKLG